MRYSYKPRGAKVAAKSNKCEQCDDQAAVKALHAEGMAYVPACDKHKAAVAKSLGSEFCSFRPYDKTKTASEGLLSGEGKSQKELEDDPDNTDYQSANSTNREPERKNTVAIPNEYTEGIPTPYFVRRNADPSTDHAPVVLDDGEDNHNYRAAFLRHQAAFEALASSPSSVYDSGMTKTAKPPSCSGSGSAPFEFGPDLEAELHAEGIDTDRLKTNPYAHRVCGECHGLVMRNGKGMLVKHTEGSNRK